MQVSQIKFRCMTIDNTQQQYNLNNKHKLKSIKGSSQP